MEKTIPEGILIEILSWLPVKSLLMFKTVSKLWHSLISNQFFVEKHAQNQMITYYENNDDIILREDHKRGLVKSIIRRFKSKMRACTTWRRLGRKYQPCCRNDRMRDSDCLMIGGIVWNPDSGKYVASLFKQYDNNEFRTSLKFNGVNKDVSCPIFRHLGMIGSCNGLICIYDYISNFDLQNEIFLWNPTIGDLKVVLGSQLQRPARKSGIIDVGFGFDSCTNDYKVIQITFKEGQHRLVHRMEIYSLNTNSWREYDHSTIPARFNRFCDRKYGSMVHKSEIFCWSGVDDDNEDVILWFDMRAEVFGTTPYPQHTLLEQPELNIKLLPLHDSVTLVFHYCYGYQVQERSTSLEIWSIGDLQDKESWTKLFNIGHLPSGYTRPLGFWNNGQFLIIGNNNINTPKKLLFYNFRQRKFVRVKIQDNFIFDNLTPCIETLVALNGYSRVYSD